MATFYADTYGYEQATGSYVPKHPIPVAKGQCVVVAGAFTCPAALATNDVAYLADMPQYAEVFHYIHWYADFGTTCTTSITYAGTDLATTYALGTAVANTAATPLYIVGTDTPTVLQLWGHYGTSYNLATSATSNILKLTFTSVSTPTAGSVYRFRAGFFLP